MAVFFESYQFDRKNPFSEYRLPFFLNVQLVRHISYESFRLKPVQEIDSIDIREHPIVKLTVNMRLGQIDCIFQAF